jgi:NADH-ubiquinone oxidoreductase chain 2
MIYRIFLNNNNSIFLKNLNSSIKDIYTSHYLWLLNTNNYPFLAEMYLKKIKESQNFIKSKKFELKIIKKTDFLFQLSNYHSFLISNLTFIILLFIFKPSILLSSTRLLSLSIFTY